VSQGLVAGFLVMHGLITVAIGAGGFADGPGLANPGWLRWWPTELGRSWVLDGLHMGPGGAVLGAALWATAGAAFVGAGLGALGMPGARDVWQPLALGAGALSLVAIGAYFHPWYAVGFSINAAVVVLLWGAVFGASGSAMR
jgi:hypothetical protein